MQQKIKYNVDISDASKEYEKIFILQGWNKQTFRTVKSTLYVFGLTFFWKKIYKIK